MQVEKSRSIFLIDNTSSSTSESVNGVQLPLEMITESLVRLPVKSLLKSKCVSKSWLSLISSPEFIKSHFSLSSSREGQYSNHQLFFTTPSPNPVIKGCFLNSVLNEPTTHVFDVECPFLNPDDESLWIVGMVNGLICLSTKENHLFIWNPVLKKSKHLPSPNVCSPKDSGVDDIQVIYGFGYDELYDDYKVVCVQCVYHTGGVDETQVKVYSLKADAWRRIEDFKGWIDWDDTGKYAYGNMYWIAWETSSDSCLDWKIVTLDMVSEKYGELQRPSCLDADNWLFVVLVGCLLVVGDYNLKKTMDLWIMDKPGDGGEQSWSKVVSIPYGSLNSRKPCPLYVLRKGEIVLANGSYLLVYNPKHKEFRNIVLDGCNSYTQSFVYVESFGMA